MLRNALYWISLLNLTRHPEGGYYKEIYRSNEIIHKKCLPERYTGFRNYSTSIYFLLESQEFSAFHRIKSDETWHFYAGTSLIILTINRGGFITEIRLGNEPERNEIFQVTIPKGTWFMAKVNGPESYSLAGCSVAPGFDFDDFELGRKDELIRRFPQHEELLRRYCIR
jgi:predicted cupin superfamily sugar epimerase